MFVESGKLYYYLLRATPFVKRVISGHGYVQAALGIQHMALVSQTEMDRASPPSLSEPLKMGNRKDAACQSLLPQLSSIHLTLLH